MRLTGRIPVEPLADDRLTQIERRVVAGAADALAHDRAPGRHGVRLVIAAALACAAAAGWLLHDATARSPIAATSALRVAASSGGAAIDIGDARIASEPASEFTVTRPGGGVVIAIARGVLALEVGPRGERPPLIVRAGDTEVIVVGTRFSVDYRDGHGDVDVRVSEGAVRVVHRDREVTVAAGQTWHSRGGAVASAGPSAAGGPDAGSVTAERGPAAAIAASAAAPEHDRPVAVPAATATSSATSPPPSIRPAAPERSAPGDTVRRRAAPRPRDPRVDLRAAIRAQPVEPARDLAEPSPATAIARFYEIAARTSGDEASQAFYSIAVLRHEKLGRDGEALSTLDAYVRRFPGGKEYRAALWLRVRILCLDKIDDRCRAAAYTYLHEAPGSPAARVAELITLAD